MGALQPMHLIVVLVIVLLVMGPGKLPDLARGIGDGIRELKKATREEDPKAESVAAAISSPAPAAIACPSCATANSVGQSFCGRCGSRLAAAPVAA
jgi:sec-independent protein translocase protein TatA